jgi:DNA-binding IclR family transcriptional regulator
MSRSAESAPKSNRSNERKVRVRPVPAVSRSIAIMRLLGKNPEPMGVNAIAQSLGLVPSTCLHILRVLVQEQLLRIDATKRYSLGVGLVGLARTAIDRNTFAAVAQLALGRLAAQWEVTAIGVEVVALDYLLVVALARAHGPFSLHVDVGSRFPALISATGRLVAAHTDRPWSEIEQGFKKVRWQNAPEFRKWRAEVEAVRRKGFSVDRGNYISGVTIIAVPLLDAANRLSHAIVAAGMTSQLDGARCTALAMQMQNEARTLSNSILATR